MAELMKFSLLSMEIFNVSLVNQLLNLKQRKNLSTNSPQEVLMLKSIKYNLRF